MTPLIVLHITQSEFSNRLELYLRIKDKTKFMYDVVL